MINLSDSLYFSSISFNRYNDAWWQDIYDKCDYPGKFYINISRRINPCRFVTRNGEWSIPWKQELLPGFEMPEYDALYKKTFDEITDDKAVSIKKRIQSGEKFALMYSGGIDSTVIAAALFKNLTKEDLRSVAICASSESIIENPNFWQKYIHTKMTIIDSSINKYDDIIEQGFTPITADEGDCIFGTLLGLNFYYYFDYYCDSLSDQVKHNLKKYRYRISDESVHYSIYKDLLIKHLSIGEDPNFGRLLYEKYDHNIKTSSAPVHSLHDFFWWLIFNVKYLNCSVRGALYYNDRLPWKDTIYRIINWFNDPEYQRWSMVNNNNGQKIHYTASTYKVAARNYIYGFDRNEWYRDFKIKLESLWNIGYRQDVSFLPLNRRPVSRIGLTKNYEMIYIDSPGIKEYYTSALQKYQIDWSNI